jgi:hypothetical protein
MARRSLPIAGNVNPRSIHEASVPVLASALERPASRASVIDAAADAESWSDEIVRGVTQAVPPDQPIACRAGCAYCCHLKVLVTAPEAIHLAEWLGARLNDEGLEELRERVAATDDRTYGMSAAERAAAKVPCPLLVDGLCVAHDARPLGCRGGNSYDADMCRRLFEGSAAEADFRFYRPQVAINEALRAGLSVAASANQLDGTLLELVAALRVLLSHPSEADEWGEGQSGALASARDEEFARLVRGKIAR